MVNPTLATAEPAAALLGRLDQLAPLDRPLAAWLETTATVSDEAFEARLRALGRCVALWADGPGRGEASAARSMVEGAIGKLVASPTPIDATENPAAVHNNIVVRLPQ